MDMLRKIIIIIIIKTSNEYLSDFILFYFSTRVIFENLKEKKIIFLDILQLFYGFIDF